MKIVKIKIRIGKEVLTTEKKMTTAALEKEKAAFIAWAEKEHKNNYEIIDIEVVDVV